MATNTIARTIIRSVARDLYFPKFSRSISVLSSIISKPSHFFVSSSFSRPTPSPAVVVTFPSHRFQFTVIRHHRSGVWSPPQRVDNFRALLSQTRDALLGDLAPRSDKHHWLVCSLNDGVGFATEQELFHFYIKTLAKVVGSEEEAKKKIYLVSCDEWHFGFGAEIDEDTKYKLEVQPGVTTVLEDYYHNSRNKDLGVRSVARFTPTNWNHRLDDIFSYHFLSESNPEWNFDHWLVHIKQPDAEFRTDQQTLDFCIQMLAEVLGSEDDAKEKIYVVWCKMPCGFGAEIDEETSNKLKGLPDVIIVLPDNAFDVKNKDRGVLLISSSSCSTYSVYKSYYMPKYFLKDSDDSDTFEDSEDFDESEDFEDSEDNMEQLLEIGDSIYSPIKSVCKHWFITLEKPGGKFASLLLMIDCYIRTLTIAVGSEEEAKRKIYRIKCGGYFFGFGAKIDEETSNNLKGLSGVLAVLPDYLFNKDQNGGFPFTNGQRAQTFLGELAMDLTKWKVEHAPQQTHDELKYIP